MRQSNGSSSSGSQDLNGTLKDLLGFESLRRAMSMGVLDGTRIGFDKLNELSRKVISTNDASAQELKQIKTMLKEWYSMQHTNGNGKIPVGAEAMVKGIKSVLDEFGDKLPLKFQTMLKNDLTRTAVAGGAKSEDVLNAIGSDLNAILLHMQERDKIVEREKLEEDERKRAEAKANKGFWEVALGKITDMFGKLAQAIAPIAGWLALLYAGMELVRHLTEEQKKAMKDSIKPGGSTYNASHGLAVAEIMKGWFKNEQSVLRKGFGSLGEAIKNGKFGKKAQGMAEGTSDFFASAGKSWSKLAYSSRKIFVVAKKSLWDSAKLAGRFSKEAERIPKLLKLDRAAEAYSFLIKGGFKATKWIKSAGEVFEKVAKPLAVVFAVIDFRAGFIATRGSIVRKTLGGLKRAVTEFFASFLDLANWIGEIATKITGIGVFKSVGDIAQKFAGTMRQGVGYEQDVNMHEFFGAGSTDSSQLSSEPSGLLKISGYQKGISYKDDNYSSIHGRKLTSGAYKELTGLGNYMANTGNKITVTGLYAPVGAGHSGHGSGNAYDVSASEQRRLALLQMGNYLENDRHVRKVLFGEWRKDNHGNSYVYPAVAKQLHDMYPNKFFYAAGHGNHLHVVTDALMAGSAGKQPKLQQIKNLNPSPHIQENFNPGPLPKSASNGISVGGEQVAVVTQEASPLTQKIKTQALIASAQSSGSTSVLGNSAGGKTSKPTLGKRNTIDDVNLALFNSLIT